jgi:hypothetical protein
VGKSLFKLVWWGGLRSTLTTVRGAASVATRGLVWYEAVLSSGVDECHEMRARGRARISDNFYHLATRLDDVMDVIDLALWTRRRD